MLRNRFFGSAAKERSDAMTTVRLLLRSHWPKVRHDPAQIAQFALGGAVSLIGAALLLADLMRFLAGQ
jgi:hypothetical protein